jgi:hypothetical protein
VLKQCLRTCPAAKNFFNGNVPNGTYMNNQSLKRTPGLLVTQFYFSYRFDEKAKHATRALKYSNVYK